MALVYERPDADVIDGEWRDEAEGQTLYDNLDETATESSLLQPAVFLCHFDGVDGATTFTDSSASAHTITQHNTAQVDTAQSKFGGASLMLSASDYLSLDGSSDFAFGTGDYTIDFWLRENSSAVATTSILLDFRTAGSDPYVFLASTATNGIEVDLGAPGTIIYGTPLTADTWYHVALTRAQSTTKLFINGISVGTPVTDTTNKLVGTDKPFIGANRALTIFAPGAWIDELRIVKNEALYTTNFQLPTTASTPATRDYIISSPNPANDMCRIRLSDQSATTPATVRYQYGRRGQIETDLTVRLKQGTTTIQEWFHADIREGLYTATQLLDASAFALITDATDLSMEFEATEPWWL